MMIVKGHTINTLRSRKNVRPFAEAILKCVFLKENAWISIKIPLKFVPNYPVNNIPALDQKIVNQIIVKPRITTVDKSRVIQITQNKSKNGSSVTARLIYTE